MSLSVCLIVKNEEDVISRCLKCVSSVADEIIVVDTGSTDNTCAEVKKFTDKIYKFDWCGDFSSARNFSLGKAECDYVMWLDADDVVTEENCEKIKKLVEQGGFDMAFLKYVGAFDGDRPTFVYYRERIFKRSCNFRFSGAVHEAVAPAGKIIYSDAEIHHRKLKVGEPLRNLKIYQNQIACGIRLDERSEFYYGRELLYGGMYRESIAVLEHFLTRNGWIENKIQACLDLYTAYVAIGDEKRALTALLNSFLYAPPRSQACCLLGNYYYDKNDVSSAIYWYQCALTQANEGMEGGFVNLDYGGFIPNIQLCVLYDRLGDYKRACGYNEAAGKFRPNDSNYLKNKQYFSKKISEV